MMAHIVLDGADILRLVEADAHQLVDHPLELGHVEVALDLRAHLKLVDLKLAQQEEGEAVWQDVLAVHLAALLLRVVALIDRVVLTQILVERDTDHAVAHNHALVQSRDLRIDAGHTDIRECLLETRESVAETRIQIVDVGILGLHVGNDALQDRDREYTCQIATGDYSVLEQDARVYVREADPEILCVDRECPSGGKKCF